MLEELKHFLKFMRPAFSRQSTYYWFVVVFVGLILRTDNLGVSSIIRALAFAPQTYPCLLHFFHSTAWNIETIMPIWWRWLVQQNVAYRVDNRLVMLGDHTKTPKDGRKMPAVTTLHQDSETASKPSYFRGHHWGCISLLVQAYDKYSAVPLKATIQEGLTIVPSSEEKPIPPKTVQIIEMAKKAALSMGTKAYLVLDAYFAVGPVFTAAAEQLDRIDNFVHILTRAKKNVVAHHIPSARKKHQRGRTKKYGAKIKLTTLFDSTDSMYAFETIQAKIYDKNETVRYLVLDLLWKPIKGMMRFILIETSRGRIILMTSDLTLDPATAIQLYCRRVTIETMFDTLKNTLGAMAYHFWSHYLSPASRRPKKNEVQERNSSNPTQTRNTLAAIEKFVNIQLLVLGMLQIIAKKYPTQVKAKAHCWLRTFSANTPSEFVTRTAFVNVIKNNLCDFAKDEITQLIQKKQKQCKNKGVDKDAA